MKNLNLANLRFFSRQRLILGLIILLAIGLRYYRWDQKFSFNAEYNYKLWPLQKLIMGRKPILIGIEAVSFLHHVHYPPLFIYMFAPILAATRFDPASIELTFILASGLTALVFYKVGQALNGKKTGYLAALLYAISFFAQWADKFIWVVGAVYLISGLVLWVLVRIARKATVSVGDAFLLGLIIGVGLNFHYQILLIPLGLIGLTCWSAVRRKLSPMVIVSAMIGTLSFILPLILFDLRHNFYNFRGMLMLNNLQQAGPPLATRLEASVAILGNLFLVLFVAPQNLSEITRWNGFSVGGMVALTLILGYMWRKNSADRVQRVTVQFITIVICIGFIVYTLLKNVWPYYLFLLQPMFIVLSAWLAVQLWKISRLKRAVIVLLIVTVIINSRAALSYTATPPYIDQLNEFTHLFNNSPPKKLDLHFVSFPSEEYAFLLYYAAERSGYDWANISIYEPWQPNNNANYEVVLVDKSRKFVINAVEKQLNTQYKIIKK